MKRTLAVVGLLILASAMAFAQSTETSATFEIADVHPSPHVANQFFIGGVLRGGRYAIKNATMVDLISTAYGVDADKVAGGPSWLEKDRFDIIAKAAPTTSPEALKLMLQSMLADRFKLVTHPDTKSMPVYVLSLGKGKPKLKEPAATGEPGCQPAPQSGTPGGSQNIDVLCHSMTMEVFAQTLRQMAGGYLSNPVVDSTGLKGSWDIEIKWTPRGALAQAGSDGISIFDAVDKQLGLKLEPQKISQPVLMVDSVNETPTENPPGVAAKLPPVPTEFEVAVIKPSAPGEQINGRIDGGQISLQATTLKFLITFAWNLNPNDQEAIVGAPKWLDSDKFDIIAKTTADANGPPAGAANGLPIDLDDLRHMLQALLIDRFKMKVHTEERPVNAYTLLAASPKMKKADPSNRAGCKNGPGADGKDPRIANPVLSRLISCQNVTMAQFAEQLQTLAAGYLFTPVLDATGLEGTWDFTLNFSPAGAFGGGGRGGDGITTPSDSGTASDPSGALSLFDAINKQLGLKLEKQKRPLPVLVIDHVEQKPTDN
jgi:uncharacterized protein (TIGR03435 family)